MLPAMTAFSCAWTPRTVHGKLSAARVLLAQDGMHIQTDMVVSLHFVNFADCCAVHAISLLLSALASLITHWSVKTHVPAATLHGGCLYVVGYMDCVDPYCPRPHAACMEMRVYHFAKQEWETLHPTDGPPCWANANLASLGDKLLLFGGKCICSREFVNMIQKWTVI